MTLIAYNVDQVAKALGKSRRWVLDYTRGRVGGLDTRGLVGTGTWKDQKSAARYAHVVVTDEAQRAALLPTPSWSQNGRKKRDIA